MFGKGGLLKESAKIRIDVQTLQPQLRWHYLCYFGDMKKFAGLLLFVFISVAVFSQPADSLPPYRQVPIIPPFKILQPDSTWFTKANLKPKLPTWIIYFSPDCGHCQQETEEILTNIGKLQKMQIVFITSRPFADMKDFARYYSLSRFSNIKIGTDPSRFITHFYKVEMTPFSAVYDKSGNLVRAYEKGGNMEELYRMAR